MDESSQQTSGNPRHSLNEMEPPITNATGPLLSNNEKIIFRMVKLIIFNGNDGKGMEQLKDISSILSRYFPLNLASFGRNQPNKFTLELMKTCENGFIFEENITFSGGSLTKEDWNNITKVRERRKQRKRSFQGMETRK